MRICFDARMMGPRNTRGIGRYAEELLRAMLALNSGHRFVLLEQDVSSSPFRDHPDVDHIPANIPWYTLREQMEMPRLIASANADLLHVPHWNVSLFPTQRRNHPPSQSLRGTGAATPLPRIVTVHDLILLEEPASANITTRGPFVAGIKRFAHRIVLANALYRSQAILVPTEHVKERIAFHYKDLKTPVIVTGEGMPDIDESAWQEPDLAHPYFMTVGSAYPHKNLETVIEAWKTVAASHPEVRLLVVGKKDQFMERLEKEFGIWNLEFGSERQIPNSKFQIPRVEFLGDVPEDRLRSLYSQAHALIFPSRWEGFGLPPLEAIARGCPVISSNASSMPEVLGSEGILFFNPASADGIVAHVETVLRDPGGVRRDIRRMAPALRQRHDWKMAAARTLEVYQSTKQD
jgi:glycosyltransferase involved in cell wall biosynthesis